MLQNCFFDFAIEHQFGCRATEPGFAGDIGAREIWFIDWLIPFHTFMDRSWTMKFPDETVHSYW